MYDPFLRALNCWYQSKIFFLFLCYSRLNTKASAIKKKKTFLVSENITVQLGLVLINLRKTIGSFTNIVWKHLKNGFIYFHI